jgi:lipopolysaccharide/colanic/teichoic acid biosynthesis glycosyltransferase
MILPTLHVAVIDPWLPRPANVGVDRTAALVRALASGGHRISLIAARGMTAPGPLTVDLHPVLPPLKETFGTPSAAGIGFGYGLRVWFALCRLKAVDAVILRWPPAEGVLASCLYAGLSGTPLLVAASRVPPQPPNRGVVAGLWQRLSLMLLRRSADHVLTPAPEIKAWFEARGFAPAAVTVHPDGCDTELFTKHRDGPAAVFDKHPQLAHGPVCVYAGALNRGRRVSEILDIAASLQAIAPQVRLLIVGDGPDRLDLNAYAARLDVLERNLWFAPALPREALAPILARASVVLALPAQMHDGGIEPGSHIFDGLAAGKPVAVLGRDWRGELIEGRQAGLTLPAGNPDAAARELADFLSEPEVLRRAGEQAQALAAGKHNAERIAAEVRQTVEHCATQHARAEVLRRRGAAVKRAFDIIVALAALTLFSPVFVLIAAGLAAAGWAPMAGRLRSGRRGKPFRLWTFDTTKADQAGVTSWRARFAHFLRRSALDRLPELFNVLTGDMSLVGPRPLPAEYAAYYTEAQQRRLEVRPGITGWAQVKGRNGLGWDEMFAHDVWYVDNRGFALDLKILAATLTGLLRGRGFGAAPAGQLPRFDEIEARRQGAEDA